MLWSGALAEPVLEAGGGWVEDVASGAVAAGGVLGAGDCFVVSSGTWDWPTGLGFDEPELSAVWAFGSELPAPAIPSRLVRNCD